MKTYVYFYENSTDLFGVEKPMNGYDYAPATIQELINQDWATEEDEEDIFVVAEGEFIFRNGKYIQL